MNGVSKLPCIWFGDNQRATAIGILGLSFALGSMFGLSLGSIFVSDSDKDDPEKIKQQVENFMWFASWASTALCAPMIFLFKQRPQVFPSLSA